MARTSGANSKSEEEVSAVVGNPIASTCQPWSSLSDAMLPYLHFIMTLHRFDQVLRKFFSRETVEMEDARRVFDVGRHLRRRDESESENA